MDFDYFVPRTSQEVVPPAVMNNHRIAVGDARRDASWDLLNVPRSLRRSFAYLGIPTIDTKHSMYLFIRRKD